MSNENAPLADLVQEAKRQVEICNACRYCEGYCAVFPAIQRERVFADADITQYANLCHNCRGCYYACQYTEPHEFAINLPQALGNVRQKSWEEFAYPKVFAKMFHKSAVGTIFILVLSFISLFAFAKLFSSAAKPDSFYDILSHSLMVAIFAPAFLFPFASICISLRRYWRHVGGRRIRTKHVIDAFSQAASMKNLSGGHGQGCNFEDEDRFSKRRKVYHQFTMYGFLLCLASTTSGTILHYVFDQPAPYSFLSPPKILGVTGGIALCIGTFQLAALKTKADPKLNAQGVKVGETAFLMLLFFVSATGLALYALAGTVFMPFMLIVHLGCVFTFFVTAPFSKMVHGFYRLAALMRDQQT